MVEFSDFEKPTNQIKSKTERNFLHYKLNKIIKPKIVSNTKCLRKSEQDPLRW